MLTATQMLAVQEDSPNLIILAGAGSGKTSVLIERLAETIQGGTPSDQIACLSYTIAASQELQKRLDARIGKQTPLFYCGTLHGFCLKTLRDAGKKISVMSESEATEFVGQVHFEFAPTKARQARLPRKKLDEILKAGPIRFLYNKNPAEEIDRVAKEIWKRQFRQNVYSYEALLYFAWEEMRVKPPQLEALFWDEFMDAAKMDCLILDAIDAKRKTLVCDPDQAIFGWRHGGNESFQKLLKAAIPI